jgi:outer membrane protein assembly factor BamB
MKTPLTAVVALFVLAFSVAARAAEDWNQFRGPSGQGVSDATGLPVELGEGRNVVWKTPIHGKAWSSPVVMGDQVWVTAATEKGEKLSAVCVDKNTGKIVHDLLLFEVATPQFIIPFNSGGSPTPTVQDGRVYVSFGSPGIACLDARTGAKVWERRDFVCNHFRGAGSSPILFGDLLILHFDGSDFQYVAAVNKNDGKTVWRTDRSLDYQDIDPETNKPKADGDWRKAFSTPRVVSFDNQPPILLSLGSKAFYAYEPGTGKELWRAENRDNHSGSVTPVVGGGLIYACMGLQGNQLWAIKPGGTGVINDTHVVWKLRKNVAGRPSPIFDNGLLYMVDDNGIASCLDAATGGQIWKERLKGNYSASPILAEGRIYLFGEDGTATVLQAGREFKVLSTGKFDDGFMASPAVSGKALFVRTKTNLYRLEQK